MTGMDDESHERLGLDWREKPPGQVCANADEAIRKLRSYDYPDEWHALVLVREVERLRAIEARAQAMLANNALESRRQSARIILHQP